MYDELLKKKLFLPWNVQLTKIYPLKK